MKKAFFDYLDEIMETNLEVYIIFAGLGYPRYDEFKKKYGDRAINTEASEQTALDIAVGLSYAGKTPFVYTITPFLLRGFETIRTYINRENLNVKMVGAGRDDDYSRRDGYSHDAGDIAKILSSQENIGLYFPITEQEMRDNIDTMIINKKPDFISLKR